MNTYLGALFALVLTVKWRALKTINFKGEMLHFPMLLINKVVT